MSDEMSALNWEEITTGQVKAVSREPSAILGQTCDNSSFLLMTSLGLETRAIRMSRARAPNSTEAPSLVSSRSAGTRRKGPNNRTSLLDAIVGTIALPLGRPV